MRTSFIAAILTLSFSLTAAAQTARVFVEPVPDTRSGVTLRIAGTWPDATIPQCANTNVAGNIITVTLSCRAAVGATIPTNYRVEATTQPLEAGTYDVVVLTPTATLARTTVTVRDANPPFRVVPDVAYPDGGETVRITGSRVGVNPTVRFGGTLATVVGTNGPDEVVVKVPAHSPGVVDVSVFVPGEFTQTSRAAFYYFSGNGVPDQTFFEPILFPVIYNGPGPFGAQWDTELTLRNNNAYFVSAPNNIFNTFCFPGCDPSPAPKTTYLVLGQRRPDGRLEYYPRHATPGLNFNSVVRDISREQNLGAEVPVLREDDFYDSTFTIANVPAEPNFRISLRLYDIAGASSVGIRIATINRQFALATATINLQANETGAASFLISDLIREYPAIAGRGPLEIEVTPQQPGGKTLWGFVSITNNATNQVTVVSPN